jgi:hypothetical protein
MASAIASRSHSDLSWSGSSVLGEVAGLGPRRLIALRGTTFGPDRPVHAHFEEAGTYRLWGQFRLGSGRVITVPFTVQASLNR